MLSKIFNMHNLHYLHYAMMAGMAIAAVAAMPLPAAATLPDLGAAFLDAGWNMLEGLADAPDVIGDIYDNTMGGDWSLNYDFGSMNHDMTGAMHDHMSLPDDYALTPNERDILGFGL